jgi:hypothetical protein
VQVGESVKLAANINTTKIVQTNRSSIDITENFKILTITGKDL